VSPLERVINAAVNERLRLSSIALREPAAKLSHAIDRVKAATLDKPKTEVAADGKTELKRFVLVGVIYAPSEHSARRRLAGADIYLDSAEVLT
jgi:hypothetical protein